jgi:hypothetical protein
MIQVAQVAEQTARGRIEINPPHGRNAGMRLFRTAVLVIAAMGLAERAAAALPFYVDTEISNSQTCTYAVKWDAPKAGGRPIELTVLPVRTPIRWAYQTQTQQFGYQSSYQTNRMSFNPGRVSFATNGRIVIRDRDLTLWILNDDATWQDVSLKAAAIQSLLQQRAADPSIPEWDGNFMVRPEAEERVVFDRDCHAYSVVNAFRSSLARPFLLHSADGGRSWRAYLLPPAPFGGGNGHYGSVRMEVPTSGKTTLDGPPALLIDHAFDPDPIADEIRLYVPAKNVDGTLTIGPAIVIGNTICCARHSGFETSVISNGDLVHVSYPGNTVATDPATGRKGTPQYVATYRRSTRAPLLNPPGASVPAPVGVGLDGPFHGQVPPDQVSADQHNAAAIAIRDDYLHVVIGGHAAEMNYRRSQRTIASYVADNVPITWTAPEYIGRRPDLANPADNSDSYTYPSLFVDQLNQPHVVARWNTLGYEWTLIHTYRRASDARWMPQQSLLEPDRPYYGAWYHKLGGDPLGRMFVSWSYRPNELTEAEAENFRLKQGMDLHSPTACRDGRCAYDGTIDISPGILVSYDQGATFELAVTDHFFINTPASPAPPGSSDVIREAAKAIILDN